MIIPKKTYDTKIKVSLINRIVYNIQYIGDYIIYPVVGSEPALHDHGQVGFAMTSTNCFGRQIIKYTCDIKMFLYTFYVDFGKYQNSAMKDSDDLQWLYPHDDFFWSFQHSMVAFGGRFPDNPIRIP